MITKEVAAKIYNAYSQIEESKKMLAELNENIKKNDGAINLINSWGEPKGFELHLPTSMSGSRVFGIGVTMGLKVLEKHIEDNERKLTELMTIAAIQLKG